MNILNVGYRSTNFYLIGENQPSLLVDIGWPGTLPTLLRIFKQKGVRLQNVPYMLATHYHPDHAGLIQELNKDGTQFTFFNQAILSSWKSWSDTETCIWKNLLDIGARFFR